MSDNFEVRHIRGRKGVATACWITKPNLTDCVKVKHTRRNCGKVKYDKSIRFTTISDNKLKEPKIFILASRNSDLQKERVGVEKRLWIP